MNDPRHMRPVERFDEPGQPSGLLARVDAALWQRHAQPATGWRAHGLRTARTALILGRDMAQGQLTLRAMSLVYTTLLSTVPLLALSFSVLKAFGVSNQIEPVLLEFLAPLGEKGVEVANNIVQFIANMNVGVLGAVGLAMLLYTAVSLVQKIEESLNFIWHIPEPRRIGERFSRYLTVLLVGPILVFSAIGLTATLLNASVVRGLLTLPVLGQLVELAGKLVPYLLVIAAFTFVYVFIPNTRVKLVPALIGGIVGGIAWQTAGWGFALFVASSNSYSAIYSGFAILLLFLIWLYLNWLILLFGASVAFYVQHPEYLYVSGGEPRLSNRLRERLALSVATLVAQRFDAGSPMPTLAELTHALGTPAYALETVVDALTGRHILLHSRDEPTRLLPARDPALITVAQVLDVVRAAGESRHFSPAALPAPQPVDAVLDRVQQAIAASAGATTLRELAAASAAATAPPLDVVRRQADDVAPVAT